LSEASSTTRRGAAAIAYRITMVAGLLLVLAANLPGHLSMDSVVALVEARTGVRQTWAPAVSSWLLKLFDSLVAGTGLYVTASAALLFVSLMSLTRLRPRTSWLAVVLGAAAIATPQVLIYQGIVWRDVLFANLVIAGFVCLAHVAKRWPGRRASLAWGLGSLAAAGVLALFVNHIAQPAAPPKPFRSASLILQHYDIVGAKAHHPKLRYTAIARADPAAAAYLEANAPLRYSQARVDTLDTDETFRKTLWHVPDAAMNAQWVEVITHYPAAYALQRADVFRWVFLTPQLERCLPVTVGVSGPDAMLADLDMVTGIDTQDQMLAEYAKQFYATPVYSHLTWALVALAVIALLLRRRDAADWVIVSLLAGALAFTASFAVISVACDYRYLYLLDLAAMVGLIYAALDPPWRKRG
jgi:hypothetical protein